MNETAIAWTNVTWNPWSGCEVISEGCKYCYAETLAEAKRGTPGFPRGFDLTRRPHKLKEPLRLKQPSMIFVNSMSDFFWEQVDDGARDEVVDIIEQTPQHEYQVLTKRHENMLRYSKRRKLPPNFWAGVTVENQRWADKRLPVLRQVDAEVLFVSAEPLIGEITSTFEGIQWVIGGGESGLHLLDNAIRAKRGMVEPVYGSNKWTPTERAQAWMRTLRDNCAASKTAFFLKQYGGPRPESGGRMLDGRTHDEFPRLPGMGWEANPYLTKKQASLF